MDKPGGGEKGIHVAKIRKLQTQLFFRDYLDIREQKSDLKCSEMIFACK